MSLALEVCRITEAQVGLEALPRVREVGLEVGDDAGVEPDNLVFCLDALLSRPPFGRAVTVLDRCQGDDLRVAWLDIDDPEIEG